MLITVLSVFALLQFVVGIGCYAWVRRQGSGAVFGSAVLALFWVCGGMSMLQLFSPVLLGQLLLLAVVAGACLPKKVHTARFAAIVGAASAVLLVSISAVAWIAVRDARREHPLVSLRERLAYEHEEDSVSLTQSAESPATVVISEDDVPRELEDPYEREMFHSRTRSDGYWRAETRTRSLKLLHASQVDLFIASAGFGVGRGVRPSVMSIELPDDPPVEHEPSCDPDTRTPSSEPRRPPTGPLAYPDADRLNRLGGLHQSALADFAFPAGWGYVRDVDHVAGFVPHAFSQLPQFEHAPLSTSRWDTVRVELVSLLKHDSPAVYLSRDLPRMDELAAAPVRPLDAFEERGLAVLHEGAETHVECDEEWIRMLGAVRAARQCLDCHQVERGTMLGAFSYVLHREARAGSLARE
jgi:hypothetical protein